MDARVVEGCPVGTTHVGWSAMLCLVHLVLHRQGKIASSVRRDVRDQDLQDVPTHVIFLVMQGTVLHVTHL